MQRFARTQLLPVRVRHASPLTSRFPPCARALWVFISTHFRARLARRQQ
ncbi:MAG: hypothetical protein JO098_05790 [Candidatus Eremiobacteraeota bacterium]|nr:hypothetical protein [Candidatus Eremiobacteraeota bacterium]